MRTLAEILAALSDDLTGHTDEELAGLATELRAAAEAARDAEGGLDAAAVAEIQAAAQAVGTIRTELTTRATLAAELAEQADAAMAELADEPEVAEAEVEAPADEPEVDAPAADQEAPADEPVVVDAPETPAADVVVDAPAELEPIAAAAVPAQPRRNVRVPARNMPRPTGSPSPVSIVASGEQPGIAPGHEFNSMGEVYEAVVRKWETMQRVRSGDGEQVHVARVDWRDQYPADRRLSGLEEPGQVMALVAAASTPESLTAAGICGPPEPRYDLVTYGQTIRPVKGALPSFNARRGQIIFNTAPTLADVVIDNTGGAIDSITAAEDAAGTVTKTVQSISCPSPTTVSVRARSLQWKVNNYTDQFSPEVLPAYVGLGQVAFARQMEADLLADIKSGSTKWTDTPAKYGAYRDLKSTIVAVVEWYRDILRDDSVTLECLIPDFVPALLVTDMTRQQPGDASYNVTVAQMRADIASWGVKPTFTEDSIRGRHLTTPSGQSPRTPGYDADVEYAIFPSGTWLYLDGGTLDLGVVRDSTLNASNQFQTFYEAWEAVAKLGVFSQWITQSLCSNGLSQIAKDVAVCSPQGS